ncbi:MAG: WbqC family protein [Cruoricaptor ignavus]|nr:WbqC family protein [Cruoricaptor ignavus]
MKKLLPIFYLPPISWFSEFLEDSSEITLEQYENFPKQTFRNRANIYGANGKLSLIIPIKHTGKRVLKDIQISYAENWQHLHWKSIKTAYQGSPYFEFYEDKLKTIFDLQEETLLQYNLKALNIILNLLKTEKAYSLNDEYIRTPQATDFREKFSAKQPTDYEMEEYYQTFSDKLGFIADLSILDLICNKGPETLTYIRNIKNNL